MKKEILIINDNESVRDILQDYLELKDYQVYQAVDGLDGVEKAKEILPNLILLDVMMPGIDGYETCRRLKENLRTQDIPVLFISALHETNDKIKGLESGGVDFINNLADRGEILARIDTHLKIRDLTQQLQNSNKELIMKQKALNEDLRAAAMIQQSLLPMHLPSLPNLEISWLCHPCELVGGDICSISKADEDSSIFYILDVSGHGVSSAMVTVSMTQYLQQKQFLNSLLSPKQVLSALNQDYPFEKFNMFSTIFYMLFNSKSGQLTYSSAGHPPAVYLQQTKPFQLLTTNGILIGVDSQFQYEEIEQTLKNGDKIILYTDGIIEFCNSQGEFYGNDRFYNLLEQSKSYPVKEIIQRISESLTQFGKGKAPHDDISILGIEYKKGETKQ